MKAPVTYVPDFIIYPNMFFKMLQTELAWEHRGDVPRCEYYCNDFEVPYTYGRGRGVRTYLPRPYHGAIREARKTVEAFTGTKFEVCFLNMYLDQSDHLGWHSDDSPEMDDERPIAIVSFGVEREIWFTPKVERSEVFSTPKLILDKDIEKLELEHGSLCVMAPGMQDTWRYKIPKSSRQCGVRISLTFRGYVHGAAEG